MSRSELGRVFFSFHHGLASNEFQRILFVLRELTQSVIIPSFRRVRGEEGLVMLNYRLRLWLGLAVRDWNVFTIDCLDIVEGLSLFGLLGEGLLLHL